MSRYYIDCRDYPGDHGCTTAIYADSKEELLEAVVNHGVAAHGKVDTPQFRQEILNDMKQKTPG